jgi:3-dehydroquinate synthase
MLAAGIGRDSAVIAVGGGVTGDLAGFVAATYMRGIPVIQIPTSLLAMLDSSVGGKTGIDTKAGKNLVGAFHHPALVLIDPVVLTTLPRVQRLAGLAEGIKTAAILDAALWDWIADRASNLTRGDPEVLSELVVRTVEHKKEVVAGDPTETGRRAILNFGHTVGHAIEALEGYTVLHGEAVAAGMRVEARWGEILGITERGTAVRIAELLEACGLDRKWETERRHDEIVQAMVLDKKSRASRPRCVFLERLGVVATHSEGDVTFALDDAALEVPLADALRPASEP